MTIFWSNTKETETIVNVNHSDIWAYDAILPLNNFKEIKIKENYWENIPQYNYSPGSTVEYTKDLQKYKGRISKIELDATFDRFNFPDKNYRYTVVDPVDPNTVIETNITSDNCVSIHMDSYSIQSAQKSIGNILLVSTQALTSLAPDQL